MSAHHSNFAEGKDSPLNGKYFKIANFPECNLDNKKNVPVNIPKWLPNGRYIVRWDWYAIHGERSASTASVAA